MGFTMDVIKAAARAYKRRSDPLLSEAGEIIDQCIDTIERLQKERDEGWANALRVQAERDAALAEVERLSAALEARTDDLQALKIEYAVVLASSR